MEALRRFIAEHHLTTSSHHLLSAPSYASERFHGSLLCGSFELPRESTALKVLLESNRILPNPFEAGSRKFSRYITTTRTRPRSQTTILKTTNIQLRPIFSPIPPSIFHITNSHLSKIIFHQPPPQHHLMLICQYA